MKERLRSTGLEGSVCCYGLKIDLGAGSTEALKIESVSCPVVSDSLQSHGLEPARLLCPWDSPDKNTGVGCHAFLQGIFLTQGLNPGLQHCRWILYHLRHQGSPGELEAIAIIQMSRAGNPRGTSEGVRLQCNFWLEKERCQGGPRFGQGQRESWTFIPWDGETGEEAI